MSILGFGLWASSGPFPLSAHYGLYKRGRDPPTNPSRHLKKERDHPSSQVAAQGRTRRETNRRHRRRHRRRTTTCSRRARRRVRRLPLPCSLVFIVQPSSRRRHRRRLRPPLPPLPPDRCTTTSISSATPSDEHLLLSTIAPNSPSISVTLPPTTRTFLSLLSISRADPIISLTILPLPCHTDFRSPIRNSHSSPSAPPSKPLLQFPQSAFRQSHAAASESRPQAGITKSPPSVPFPAYPRFFFSHSQNSPVTAPLERSTFLYHPPIISTQFPQFPAESVSDSHSRMSDSPSSPSQTPTIPLPRNQIPTAASPPFPRLSPSAREFCGSDNSLAIPIIPVHLTSLPNFPIAAQLPVTQLVGSLPELPIPCANSHLPNDQNSLSI